MHTSIKAAFHQPCLKLLIQGITIFITKGFLINTTYNFNADIDKLQIMPVNMLNAYRLC